jgi:TolB protein
MSMMASFLSVIVSATLSQTPAAPAPAAPPKTGPIVGDVEGGEFRAFPIAIASFRGASPAELVTSVVRADLAMSGAFQVLDAKSFIDTDGVNAAEIRYPDWQNVGAQGLVKATVRADGAGFVVDVRGYDIAGQKALLEKQFTGKNDDARAVAHAISDEIFRVWTGEPGVFRTKIAVVKKVKGEKHVFLVDVDGENSRQLTKGGGLNLLPSLSPDGASMLFTSYRNDNPDLYEMSLRDGAVRPVSQRPGLNTGGRVSPDGDSVALTLSQDGDSEIYLLDRQGAVQRRLTKTWGIDTSPAWSPDGNTIAFVSSRGKNPQIYTMGKDGSSPKQLTFQGTYNQTPIYSPRGTHIAFTGRDESARFDIFVLQLATGTVTRITQSQGNNEEPSFSPNGRLLAFTTTRNGKRQLVISTIDGKQQTVLPSVGEHHTPSWGPFVR